MPGMVYEDIGDLLQQFVAKIVREAKIFAMGEDKKIIKVQHVLNALRKTSGEEWGNRKRKRKELETDERVTGKR